MRSPSSRAVFSLAAICLLYLGHIWLFKGLAVDDTLITLRFVQQWVHGNGLVYNLGERVEGYSNFLWLVILAPFEWIGWDLILSARLVSIGFGVSTLVLTWYLSRRFSRAAIAPLLLAFSAPFAAWSVSGLETLLFTFLATLSAGLFVIEEKEGRGWLSGVAYGALALARPEGALFASTAVAYRAWHLFRKREPPKKRDYVRLISLLAVFLPYWFWRVLYYGSLLPNTVYAKSMGLHPRAVLEGAFYIFQSFNMLGGPFFIAALALLAYGSSRRPGFVRYFSAIILLYAFFVIVWGGDWMPLQRFLVHVLPLLYLIVQEGFLQLPIRWPSRASMPFAFTALLALQVAYLSGVSLEQRFIHGLGSGAFLPPRCENYLCNQVRADDTIAVVDAGYAYSAPLSTRVIDMVGLTDPHIARLSPRFPSGLFGRGDGFGKWDVEYVLSHRPRLVQAHLIAESPDGRTLTDFTGTTLLINHERFRQQYRLAAPGIFERIGQ